MNSGHDLRAFALALTMLPLLPAYAADWSDTSVQLRQGRRFTEPGNPEPIAKTVLNLTHVSGDRLGANLLLADVLKSDANDPATGGGGGAQEAYAIVQRTLSLPAISGQAISAGPFKDLSLVSRLDLNTKNVPFAPQVRKLRLGLEAALPISAGFWNVGVHLYDERNNNGIVGRRVHFDRTWSASSTWAIPVGSGITFGGLLDLTGAKGRDGFGAATRPELLARATLMFDIGGRALQAGFGYEGWRNKYGNDDAQVVGSRQDAVMLLAQYHF